MAEPRDRDRKANTAASPPDPRSAGAGAGETGTLGVEELADVAAKLVRLWELVEVETPPHLSPPQLRVLTAVWSVGRIAPGALAQQMGAAVSSVSRLCMRLESAALLSRRHAPHDRRRTMLSLTGHGLQVLRDLRSRRLVVLTRALSATGPAEAQALRRGLRKLRSLRVDNCNAGANNQGAGGESQAGRAPEVRGDA